MHVAGKLPGTVVISIVSLSPSVSSPCLVAVRSAGCSLSATATAIELDPAVTLGIGAEDEATVLVLAPAAALTDVVADEVAGVLLLLATDAVVFTEPETIHTVHHEAPVLNRYKDHIKAS